jgi:hypothetical protein
MAAIFVERTSVRYDSNMSSRQGRTEVLSTLPVNTLPDQNKHHAHTVVPRPYAQGQ